MANGEYTIKEILNQMDLRINSRLDNISGKLDAKAEIKDLIVLEKRIYDIQREIDKREPLIIKVQEHEAALKNIQTTALDSDKVKNIISDSLKDSESRGWTRQERLIGMGVLFISIGSLMVGILSLALR